MRNYREILERRAEKEELVKQHEIELELFESYKNIDKIKKYLKRLEDQHKWRIESFNQGALELYLKSNENRSYHQRRIVLEKYIKDLELLFSKMDTN